jgi:hypothetical protein
METDHFLRIGGTLLDVLGAEPGLEQVEEGISAFTELFRALSQPSRKSVQGLWGELFVAARATDSLTMVESWHVTPEDRYDFNAGHVRIEVKSVGGRIRKHRFSLEQLQPPRGTCLLIASLYAEQAGGGLSLQELMDELSVRLDGRPDLRLRVGQVVARTMGRELPAALDARFDAELASESLRFYLHDVIPIIESVPAEVTNVEFTAELTYVPVVTELAGYGSLAAAARPVG